MSYTRVIPRDLFNEADLLKCYGRLWILLEKGPHTAEMTNEGQAPYEPFEIDFDESDGSLTITNIAFTICGDPWRLWRPNNSRKPWPLYCSSMDEEVSEPVFTSDGNLSAEFLQLISV